MSSVIRTGDNAYMVSAGGGNYEMNSASLKEEVYNAAASFCQGKGQSMQEIAMKETPYRLGRNRAEVELRFACE